jgi:hypothetical protein
MKKSIVFIASIIVASLLLAISLTACEAGVSVTTASLSEATMCQSVDEDMRPIDATDVFTTDTPEIFCSVKLSHAPSDTDVKAEWIYVQGELEGTENYLIGDYSLTAEGTLYLSFSLTKPDAGWPKGEYKVILYVDGKEKLSVPFTVQ